MNSKKQLKIAIIHAADHGGGAERSVLTLHHSLREAGHDSRLYVGSKSLDEEAVEEIPRSRPIPGLLRLTRWMENSLGIQNLYAPWFRNLDKVIGPDVDVVHFHTLWGGQYGYADLTGVVRLSKRYPTVMTLRDGWMMTGHCACPIGCDRWKTGCGKCPDLKRPPSIKHDLTAINWKRKRKAIQKSNLHITTVSSWLKKQVQASPIFTGKPISVVHNSMDETEFTPGDKLEARKKLDIPEEAFVVLLAAKPFEKNSPGFSQHAVEALNQLNDPRILPMLVGHSAKRLAAMLKNPSKTIPFQKTSEGMCQCYRAADLTIVPSEYETFGRVAAESQFCGTPVLAFATGGLTDVVDAEKTGWLVPTGETQTLKEKLKAILDDHPSLKFRSENCRPWSMQRFTKDRICNEYLEVYRTAVQSGQSNLSG